MKERVVGSAVRSGVWDGLPGCPVGCVTSGKVLDLTGPSFPLLLEEATSEGPSGLNEWGCVKHSNRFSYRCAEDERDTWREALSAFGARLLLARLLGRLGPENRAVGMGGNPFYSRGS